jgi:hypothetical protein
MNLTATMPAQDAKRSRACEHFVTWLRELKELREGGLVSDQDFCSQRTEKLDELFDPPRFLGFASVLGGSIVGGIGGAITWWFTGDLRFTALAVVLADGWGLTSLGRIFREKFVELQLNGRMKILIALLEHDLINATEFSKFEEQLARGRTDVV